MRLTDLVARQILKLQLNHLDLFLERGDDLAKILRIQVLEVDVVKLVTLVQLGRGIRSRLSAVKHQLASGFGHFN